MCWLILRFPNSVWDNLNELLTLTEIDSSLDPIEPDLGDGPAVLRVEGISHVHENDVFGQPGQCFKAGL